MTQGHTLLRLVVYFLPQRRPTGRFLEGAAAVTPLFTIVIPPILCFSKFGVPKTFNRALNYRSKFPIHALWIGE